MVKKAIFSSLLFASVSLFAEGGTHGTKGMNSKNEIQEVFNNFASTWSSTHDANQLAGFFTNDGDLINPFGRMGTGRQGVMEVIKSDQMGPLKGSMMQMNISNVRMIGLDTAFVDVTVNVTMKGEKGQNKEMPHHLVALVVKQGGKWMVVSARPYFFAPKQEHMHGHTKGMK